MSNWDGREPSPPESAYMLCYHPAINRFVDEDGMILHDLSDLFDLWELDEWKKHQSYDLMQDKKGDWAELYYLSPGDEADVMEYVARGVCYHDQQFVYAYDL